MNNKKPVIGVTAFKNVESPQPGFGVARCLKKEGFTVIGLDDTPLTSAIFEMSFTSSEFSFVTGTAILILTPFLANFSNSGFRASTFLITPLLVVIKVTLFLAFLTSNSKWVYILCLPLIAPAKSAGSINSIPCLCNKFNSCNISVPFRLSNLLDLSSASTLTSFLTLSTENQ